MQLLWNGSGFVVLNYISSSTILSFNDFLGSAVNHGNTVYSDAETTVDASDMDGTVLHPYINPQDAVDNANDGDTIITNKAKFESIENSLLLIDPNTAFFHTTCTNRRYRLILQISYK